MVVIGQIDALNDVFAFVTDVNGKEFRVPRELIREPMFGNYYQFDGTFLESDVLEPTSVTALANDSKALLDARAKLWDEKFGNDKCTLQKIKEMGIDSLVKKIFDSSVSEEAMEENETEQKANDNVKLHVEVKRSGRKSKNGAEIYCADNFPLVIDSSGLLNRFLEEEPIIRHAPERKFGVWCAPRRYSIDGINWKIVQIDREIKPKKSVSNGVSKMNGRSKECVSNGGQTDECNSNSPSTDPSLPSTTVRNSPKLEEEEEKVDENELFEGLICSQNETHFLVFSPGRRWLGRLDKAKCGKDSASILGMWIQFKIKNKAGMKFVDTRFNFTRQKIIATPTGDYVLIRCRLSVPPFLEVNETPWCEELRTNVIDKAEILKQEHYGKTILAVIGCPAQVVDEDSYILKWQLLSVVD
ncbi:hypothetical protein niasHT_008040 [Heterodera trifolii]|uniref:Uncharacterized protein n=1 Tax=Heterodera trifolii TaxID=157864 RepID=A0ABD2M084_9BILA